MNTTITSLHSATVKKMLLSLSISITGIISVCGQNADISVKLSQEYEEPKNSMVFDVVSANDNGIILGRIQRKGLTNFNVSLEKYSDGLSFQNTRDYEAEAEGEEIDFTSPFEFGGAIYMLGTNYIKKLKKRNVFYQEVSGYFNEPDT